MAFRSHDLDAAYREAVAAADNAVRATFEGVAAGTRNIYGDEEVWVRATFSVAATTATATVYFYESDGTFLGTSGPLTIDATALQDGTRYMSQIRTTANPGADLARLHLTTLSAGNADLYLGARSDD